MNTIPNSKKSFFSGLTGQILIAMFLGAVLGIILHNSISPEAAQSFSNKIKMLATIFIRLVQMIISPLVFTTLVVGIAKLGDIKAVGRIGGKALGWFFTASFISLLIGLFYVNILQPGVGLQLGHVDLATASEVTAKTGSLSFENFIEHIVPKSLFEAMATNEILQIVIFSIFFGLAAASLGDTVKPVITALDKSSHIVLKMVNYVMNFAPIGVFGAIAGVFAVRDFQELAITYFKFFGQ
jgi:Na+/H+-dicarboxylate symporter